MKTELKSWVKDKALSTQMGMSYPQYALQRSRARAAYRTRSGPRPVQILVICDGKSYTSDQQFAPITRHIDALRRTFGHVFRFRKADDSAAGPIDLSDFGAVILKLSYLISVERAEAITGNVRKYCDRYSVPLIYFDGDDDLCVQFDCAIEAADLYVKKHAFADRRDYTRDYVGRSNLTDYAKSKYGADFSNDQVPYRKGLSEQQIAKITVGWNISLDDKIAKLAEQIVKDGTAADRDIDVMCRASAAPPGTLFHAMRNPALVQMEKISQDFTVLVPNKRVDQAEYYREMKRSKMCVCPFGFGELCWRDFEAALCGALILKPDMSHATTSPDIFQPNVSYVPLKWDYSDLGEKVRHFLARPEEAAAIARKAQSIVLESLSESWFLDRYRSVVSDALVGSVRAS